MVAQTPVQHVFEEPPSYGGFRNDFVRALRAIGETLMREPRVFGAMPSDRCHVRISCSREAWLRAFGEEEIVAEYRDAEGHATPVVWMHRCIDGVVLCLGWQHGGSRGNSWINVDELFFC